MRANVRGVSKVNTRGFRTWPDTSIGDAHGQAGAGWMPGSAIGRWRGGLALDWSIRFCEGRRVQLKYDDYLRTRRDQPCPRKDLEPPRRPGSYRFLRQETETSEDDFVPPAIKDGPKDRDKCDRFALSFFTSLDAARSKYAILAQRLDAASRYGSHIGRLDLTASDGLADEPNGSGHFNLHPAEEASFTDRVLEYYDAT